MKREEITAIARSWLDTPYQLQKRIKGLGVDCAGVLVDIARETGYLPPDFDVTGYTRPPFSKQLSRSGQAVLDQNFERVPTKEIAPGDVAWMRLQTNVPTHIAIVAQGRDGSLTLIHASPEAGRCVEHRLNDVWRARIVKAYRFRGVED